MSISHTPDRWLDRLKRAFIRVAIGFAVFAASFALLWANEGRAVQTYKSLNEGAGAVVAVGETPVDAANEGKLVHVTGRATTEEVLTDPDFGVSARALRLERTVEMFQWTEHLKSETTKRNPDGSDTTVRTYTYRTGWHAALVSSSQFDRSGYENPDTFPHAAARYDARVVTLGAFTLSKGLAGQIRRSEALSVTPEMITRTPAPTSNSQPSTARSRRVPSPAMQKPRAFEGRVYVGADPARPRVGDMRISYTLVRPTAVSIVARQAGQGLTAYQTMAGDAIERLDPGTHAADQMFALARRENVAVTWMLRAAFSLVMTSGLRLMLGPFAAVASPVSVLGSVAAAGATLVSAAVAFVLAAATIATAWLAYRPMLALSLLLSATVALLALLAVGQRRTASLKTSP